MPMSEGGFCTVRSLEHPLQGGEVLEPIKSIGQFLSAKESMEEVKVHGPCHGVVRPNTVDEFLILLCIPCLMESAHFFSSFPDLPSMPKH
jgi:hypothetical protein